MSSKKSLWYHIGHAFESARSGRSSGRALAGPRDRARRKEPSRRDRADAPSLPSTDELMAAGVAVVVDHVLGLWGRREQPGFGRLVRAGLSGAAAALLVDLTRPLLTGEAELPGLDRGTLDRMLAGAGQGLVYGAVLEPRVPGPALLKGALYGSIEYVADPLGGVAGLLGSHAPQRKLPLVGGVFDELEEHERAYLEHLVFGVALAILYDPNRSSNGIRPDDE